MVQQVKKHSILVVDDEQENVNLISNILGNDYVLYKARDGESAMEVLRERDVDMILTDQRMPGISGVDLLEKARQIRPDAVRILVTAYPDADNAIQSINRGWVKRYITKPFDPSELKVIIAQEMEHLDLVLANRRLNAEMGRMVEELFRANRELRDLNRMKDQFLANCSHELKTPLVSGMGYVEMLLSGGLGKLDERQLKGLRIAHRNLERLLGLIENLLALARQKYRPEELNVTRFNLRPLVEECVESLKGRSRKKSLRVRLKFPRNPVFVEADERKIHGVLTNVLANAEKFTPEDSRIDIRVEPAGRGRIRIRVADNGIGPGEAGGQIQLFKTTTDPKYAGLGIGLMLARQVLHAHGGDISLERGRRRGAVVTFDLPAAKR